NAGCAEWVRFDVVHHSVGNIMGKSFLESRFGQVRLRNACHLTEAHNTALRNVGNVYCKLDGKQVVWTQGPCFVTTKYDHFIVLLLEDLGELCRLGEQLLEHILDAEWRLYIVAILRVNLQTLKYQFDTLHDLGFVHAPIILPLPGIGRPIRLASSRAWSPAMIMLA